MLCAACGEENPERARFCLGCGAPLTAPAIHSREERKVVTAVFCDLIGFTARSEAMDVEDVRGTLRPYHELLRAELERFGGTVEKFIGDAVMALFGAPVAHEDDPERAVRAALAIIDAVARLREDDPRLDLHVRIGVNTGEALIALDADPGRGEGMASGDVINTAARLQTAAPADGVLVGEVTYRATERVVRYQAADPVHAKGKTEPVPAWVALGARSRFGIDVVQESRSPLVGRSEERDALVGAMQRAFDRRSVSLVTVVGVPGIGKSRLVWELFREVDARPDLVTWRQGRSLPYGEGLAYWALGEMIKSHAGVRESDDAAIARAKLDEMSESVLPDARERDWVLRHVHALVGVEPGDAHAGADERTEAFAAWRRLVEGIAQAGPLVLVFEDLHWADDALLEWVDYLVEWATDVPLLIVGTARPELLERRRDWGGGKPNAITLALDPLSDADTARLLGSLLDQAVMPAEMQQALLERAQGNPLYAEEYVRMLVDRGQLDRANDAPLPESVHGIIAARLDMLPEQEKLLLQDAAVIGKVAWAGGICELGGVERFAAEERLHRLVRKEFLRRAPRSSVEGDTEYVFRHALVRDVAYGQIPRAARADKHRRAAAWLERLAAGRDETIELRAHHYRSALEYARASGTATEELETAARTALADAAARAAALGSSVAAVALYEAALGLCPPGDPLRPRLQFGYLDAATLVGPVDPDLFATTRDALIEQGEPGMAAATSALEAIAHVDRADYEAALTEFERGVHIAESAPTSREKGQALSDAAISLALMGYPDRGAELGKQALHIGEQVNDPTVVVRALGALAMAHSEGDREGIALLERAAETARRAGSPALTLTLFNLAGRLEALGRLADARRALAQAGEAARRFGNPRHLLAVRIGLFVGSLSAGGWAEAEREATALLESGTDEASEWDRAQVLFSRAQVRVPLGRLDAAAEDAERFVDFARRSSEPQMRDGGLSLHARCLAELGRAEAALTAVEEWMTLDLAAYIEPVVHIAVAVWLAGAPERFAAMAQPSYPTPWYKAAAHIARGAFPAAAEIFAAIGALAHEADAHLRAAERLTLDGRPGDAAPHLERAVEIYRGEGATLRLEQLGRLQARAAG